MKTVATPLRPLLLTLGALAAIAAVLLGVNARPQAQERVAGEPHATPPAAVAEAEAPLVVATAGAVAPVGAGTPAAAPRVATESPAAAGLRVYFDPETGEITSIPPQSEVVPLAGAQQVRPDRLPEITLADGSVIVRLDERFEETTVMSIDANGRRVVTCGQHPGQVHAHAAAVPVVDAREVK